jgi:D-alanyl-lipoteichoic acid acyltransferase DltB (MBOAT superfamily)
MVRGCSSRFHGDELSVGEMASAKAFRAVLSAGILLNLALLGSFKYLPEIAVSLPLSSLQRFSHLALPLGISFWTFQAMSYLFDLYRERNSIRRLSNLRCIWFSSRS